MQKEFEARTRIKMRVLNQLGKLLARHVEYCRVHHELRPKEGDHINRDGGTTKITISERYYGQRPQWKRAPFGARVMARQRVGRASSSEGRYGAG